MPASLKHHFESSLIVSRSIPADDAQFEAYEAGYVLNRLPTGCGAINSIPLRHLVALILESSHGNPFFRSPVSSPEHILDIGTGKGTWAM
jgi:hypothetical protein